MQLIMVLVLATFLVLFVADATIPKTPSSKRVIDDVEHEKLVAAAQKKYDDALAKRNRLESNFKRTRDKSADKFYEQIYKDAVTYARYEKYTKAKQAEKEAKDELDALKLQRVDVG